MIPNKKAKLFKSLRMTITFSIFRAEEAHILDMNYIAAINSHIRIISLLIAI